MCKKEVSHLPSALCVSLKDLILKVGKNGVSGKEAQMKLKKHNIKNLAKHSIEVGKHNSFN
jgi:hypothetical protein